jgi:hypothetical protein
MTEPSRCAIAFYPRTGVLIVPQTPGVGVVLDRDALDGAAVTALRAFLDSNPGGDSRAEGTDQTDQPTRAASPETAAGASPSKAPTARCDTLTTLEVSGNTP